LCARSRGGFLIVVLPLDAFTFCIRADDLAYEKQGADVFMSGYLVKQGGNRKNWKKRFCVLTSDSIRYYGKKKVTDHTSASPRRVGVLCPIPFWAFD
jgi:hypothetical protein